ncbi:MAG: DUF6644 family protein [Steroidobacteraceae bacterium]
MPLNAFADWLHATPFSQTIQSVFWIVPLVQSIHIVMIGIVFMSSVVIALRVLGHMRADEPFSAVWARFAPWLWGAFVAMILTGILMIIGEPGRQFGALSFWIKMTLVLIAVLTATGLGALMKSAPHDASTPLRGPARPMAVGLIVLWLAIVFLGRAIAYDVEVWGQLSPHAS